MVLVSNSVKVMPLNGVKRKDGTEKAVLNTKWTQKGRLGLYEILKQHEIYPMIEQLMEV